MTMAGCAVVQPGAIAFGREQALDFGALHEARGPVVVVLLIFTMPRLQFIALTRLERSMHLAPGQVALD